MDARLTTTWGVVPGRESASLLAHTALGDLHPGRAVCAN